MRILWKIGWGVVALVVIAVVGIFILGMGQDMMRIIPLWVCELLIGGITFIVGACILAVFVLGIVGVIAMFKRE